MGSQGVLAGQAALVTGGGGGIGGASAAWLARDGASVMIMGRTEKTLAATKERIKEFAGPDATVEYFVGDALEAGELSEALAAAASLSERLAIAVSVVGGGNMKPLLMFDDAEALEEMRKNIVSAFMVIRHATPLMADKGGSIVCISSDAAKIAWPFLTMYNTSKSGVEGLVRGAAMELSPLRIRVNAVRPGLVETDTTRNGLFKNEAVMQQFLVEKPLGRTGRSRRHRRRRPLPGRTGIVMGDRAEHRYRGRGRDGPGPLPRIPRPQPLRRRGHRRRPRRSNPLLRGPRVSRRARWGGEDPGPRTGRSTRPMIRRHR